MMFTMLLIQEGAEPRIKIENFGELNKKLDKRIYLGIFAMKLLHVKVLLTFDNKVSILSRLAKLSNHFSIN